MAIVSGVVLVVGRPGEETPFLNSLFLRGSFSFIIIILLLTACCCWVVHIMVDEVAFI